jgi:hypothetical protein
LTRLGRRGGSIGAAGVEGPVSSVCHRKKKRRVYVEVGETAPFCTVEVGLMSTEKGRTIVSEGKSMRHCSSYTKAKTPL